MLFTYHAIDQDGHERDGTIEAPSEDVAVSALQRRNLIVSVIEPFELKVIDRSCNGTPAACVTMCVRNSVAGS